MNHYPLHSSHESLARCQSKPQVESLKFIRISGRNKKDGEVEEGEGEEEEEEVAQVEEEGAI